MSSKKVQVEVKQGAGFKTECRAGKHLVVIDQPAPSGGTDAGPSPLEVQLMALGGCMAAIGKIIASQKKIALRGIEISLEAELDTDGLLGKATGNRVGFGTITARAKIDADLTPAEKLQFLQEIESRCPVSENLQHPTPVHVGM